MFELLFKYPASLFHKGQFVFLTPWPVWLLAIMIVVTAGALFWHVRRNVGMLTGARPLAIWLLESGLIAQVSCTFATARHRHAFIAGDEGSIATTYYNDTSPVFPPLLEVKRGKGWDAQREILETASTNGFLAEAEAFAELVAKGAAHWSGATPDESIDIALTLEALAESARRNVAVEVGAGSA